MKIVIWFFCNDFRFHFSTVFLVIWFLFALKICYTLTGGLSYFQGQGEGQDATDLWSKIKTLAKNWNFCNILSRVSLILSAAHLYFKKKFIQVWSNLKFWSFRGEKKGEKTIRFPFIGSWCVWFPVVTQYVMAAVCFHILSTNFAFKYAFIIISMFIMTGSPPHLGRLPI